MSSPLDLVKRVIVPLCLLALVVAAGLTMFLGGDDTKKLTAHFPRTVSLYEGSAVKVLGVQVGAVDKVTPSGTDVVVQMHYDSDVAVPSDARPVSWAADANPAARSAVIARLASVPSSATVVRSLTPWAR